MGLVIAEKLVENTTDPEIRIWRAVLSMALEDVMIVNQNRTESVLKGEAHDWFCNNSEDFKFVCFQAEMDPNYVRMKYLESLDKGNIFFTMRKNLEKLKIEMNAGSIQKLLINCGKLYLNAPIRSMDRQFFKHLYRKIKKKYSN